MKRSIVLCVVALALSGCKSSQPPGPDPFFGQTTVPPPGTGSAVPPGSYAAAPGPLLTPPSPSGYAGSPAMGTASPPSGYFAPPGPSASTSTPPGYATGSPTFPGGAAGRPTAPGYPPAMPASTGGYPAGGMRPSSPAPGNTAPTWGTQPATPPGYSPYAPPSNLYRSSAVAPSYGTNASAAGAPAAAATPPTSPTAPPGSVVRIAEPVQSRPLGTFAGASSATASAPTAALPAEIGRPVTTDPASIINGRQPIVRSLPARSATTDPAARGGFTATAPGGGPAAPAPASPLPRRSVNITDLPDADAPPPADARTASTADRPWTSAAPAGGTTVAAPPGGATAGVQKMSFKADAPYGYDTNYQWLRGQLDYAPGSGGWRIIYVPAYGEPDRLGGSLAIANPQALTGLQRGDYVELRGRPAQQWTRGALSTVYQVASAQRLTGAGQ